ncbi:MAG: glutaredoxin domain-containing protein [Patescibacteria group bacterium]
MKKVVKVFSTPTCPYCVMLKNYLREQKVEFEDIDVSIDHEAAKKMIAKSQSMSVPQSWIDDKVIIGFDTAVINAELGIK